MLDGCTRKAGPLVDKYLYCPVLYPCQYNNDAAAETGPPTLHTVYSPWIYLCDRKKTNSRSLPSYREKSWKKEKIQQNFYKKVVVVYHVDININGYGYLYEFGPLTMGCVLRTAGSFFLKVCRPLHCYHELIWIQIMAISPKYKVQ